MRLNIRFFSLLLIGFSSCTLLKPEPPYTCGFVVKNRKAIEKVWGPEMAVLHYLPGQQVAFIGASNGYRAAMLSVLTDSLSIYLQDIDNRCLNQEEVGRVHSYYEGIRGSKFSNQFQLVLGTENSSNLPRGHFDKISVTATYHHFSDAQAMLKDLKGALKPGGKLYILENVVEESGQVIRKTCPHPLFSEKDLEQQFQEAGFEVLEKQSLHQECTRIFVLGIAHK